MQSLGIAQPKYSIRWWQAGGAPPPIVAYQPCGSYSLADSYINKCNPGYLDAVVGVAPTFQLSRGWVFTGTQYLKSGVIPASGYSMFIKYSGVSGSNTTLAGSNLSGAVFQINPNQAAGGPKVNYANGGVLGVLPELLSGSVCVAGTKAYRNGVQETGSMSAWTAISTYQVFIGAVTVDGVNPLSNITANIQMLAIWPQILTSGMVSAIHAAAAAIIGKKQAIFDGDSLTGGAMVSLPDRYPTQTIQALGGLWGDATNLGIASQKIGDLLSDVTTQVDPLYDSSLPKNIVCLWIGINDLNVGTSGSDIYTGITTYISGRRAVGFKVVVLTSLKSTILTGTKETERNALNSLIISNSAGADAVVDVASNMAFSDPNNVTYYSDGTHLTPAGYTIVASMVSAVVRSL